MKYVYLIILTLLIASCTTQAPSEMSEVESCGEFVSLDEKSNSEKAANCFYSALEDCSIKSMNYKINIPLETTTLFRATITGEKAGKCLIQWETISSTRNFSSGVALVGTGNPHVGASMECTYGKSKPSRSKSNDKVYATYLYAGMYKAAEEGKCQGDFVDLIKQDKQNQEAFSEALKKSSILPCEKMQVDYRNDCKNTIESMIDLDEKKCELVQDTDMRLVCSLKMLQKYVVK